MNKNIIILLIIQLFIGCSSDDNSSKSTFSIDLVPSATNVVIDQAFTVTINANESIKYLWVSTDNFATGDYAIQNFGTSFTLNLNFDTLGQKTISVRAKNQNNEVSEKQIVINVTRGNAIKILGVQVVSFYGINTVYDPEFPASNPESLADLKFGFAKQSLDSYLSNIYSWRIWYQSTVIPNQGTMTWDFSNANLYIDPSKNLRFGLADIDNGIAGADLLNGPPDYREINFSNFVNTKPSSITYTFPEINLEFKVFVEWAN
ncbi:MAG: hypothetical protein ACOYBS_05120 [Flavobacterium sp.]